MRYLTVTGVQTCALPICPAASAGGSRSRGPSSRTRATSCSTSPSPGSTPSPSATSRRSSRGSRSAGSAYSSPTTTCGRRSRSPIARTSCTTAASWRRGPPPSSPTTPRPGRSTSGRSSRCDGRAEHVTMRLSLRQTQRVVMTPLLQQAIQLLQLSTLELKEVVEEELRDNPLLEEVPTDGTDTTAEAPSEEIG